MLWNLNYSNRNSQSYEKKISLEAKVCCMLIRGWIISRCKVTVIHVQLSFLQWQNNSQLGYSCAIWFHQGLWHTRCDLSGEWLWLEHYWHYFITKCESFAVVRLPLSNFSLPSHPPLFFSVPVPSVKCYDNITHSIQAVRDESKVFSTLNTEGRWKLVNNTIFLLDLYEEIYFLFFYIPNTETAEISNATLYVLPSQPILSLNNISICGYLITREIITVTSEPASLMRNAFVSSLGLLSESNEYAILKDILPGSKM